MKYPLLTIAANGGAITWRNRYRKTRAFQCTLLRAVSWPGYRSSTGKNNNALRPVFIDFCGSESEHRAFTANLRCGNIASMGDGNSPTTFELLRSEPYFYASAQKCDAGIRQIVYLPEVWDLDARSMPDPIYMAVMPPCALMGSLTAQERATTRAAMRLINVRIEQEREQLRQINAHLESWRRQTLPERLELDDKALDFWALTARELCVRLDARTLYPIPPDPEFRAVLLAQLLVDGHLQLCENHPLLPLKRSRSDRWRMPVQVHGPSADWRTLADCGYLLPTALSMKQDELGKLLAGLARGYYAR